MRGEWCVPLAAVALLGGSLLAATGPAANAAPVAGQAVAGPALAAVQSGGSVRGLAGSHTVDGLSPGQVTSTDWAGYAATGATGEFTSIASSWTEPTVKCKSGDQYASFWVGLDGYSSDSVEQIGVDADCVGKTPDYFAWYEMYPANPVTFSNVVDPGDHFTASVTYKGGNKFSLSFTDSTQGWTRTVSASLAGAARTSAEIIVETPSGSGGTLPLSDFGSVSFTGATVNGSGLCDADPVKISSPGFTVSPITDCTNFTVTQTPTEGSPHQGPQNLR